MAMRPTVVSVITRPSGGGAEFLVRHLHAYLQENKFHSILIFLDSDGQLLKRNEIALPYGVRSLANIWALRCLLRRLKSDHPKLVVHAHLTWAQLFTVFASLGLGITLVCTEHSTSNRRRRLPMVRYVERVFYSAFHEIICISAGVHASMLKWLGSNASERLRIIHNGARNYPSVSRPRLNGRKARLVSIGSLTEKKNFATAIKAVARVRDQIEKYVIIGRGEEHDKLAAIIAEEGLLDVVELVGWQDDPSPWLYTADIQLIPSRWEGFGLVAVEGMSTGLPIVASDVDGLREVVAASGHGSLFVQNPLSVEAWGSGIETMIDCVRADQSGEIPRLAHANASRFSLETMCHSYTQTYERVAA
jgi:glycosyltransferase involved in cell wall biosynthesis